MNLVELKETIEKQFVGSDFVTRITCQANCGNYSSGRKVTSAVGVERINVSFINNRVYLDLKLFHECSSFSFSSAKSITSVPHSCSSCGKVILDTSHAALLDVKVNEAHKRSICIAISTPMHVDVSKSLVELNGFHLIATQYNGRKWTHICKENIPGLGRWRPIKESTIKKLPYKCRFCNELIGKDLTVERMFMTARMLE